MKSFLKCGIKPYIQPFEKKLALAELAVLAGSDSRLSQGDGLRYELQTGTPAAKLADNLAYWESVTDTKKHYTKQVLREATVNIIKNGIPVEGISDLVPFSNQVPLPNRRCLRYGPHGFHDYRGKFFPQLVRALINIAGVPKRGIIADPMIGSGTTAVETVLAGSSALGLDMNPLSVMMSRTKCAILREKPTSIISAYANVRKRLIRLVPNRSTARLPYFSRLPNEDQRYLLGWFSEQVLRDLDQIAQELDDLEDGPVRDLMLLTLSNILRTVSWQKPDDLRVRKEAKIDQDIDPIKEFLEALGRSVKTIIAFLYQEQDSILGSFDILEGDARDLESPWKKWMGRVDAVITSPPYATALPYLDTDRLSLCYLGLLPRPEHRKRDVQMIGNREISNSLRKAYLEIFQSSKKDFPRSVLELVAKINHLNNAVDVGFRRRNLAALLAKYFMDMKMVLNGIANLLRPGARAYIVIGNNHTIAGGKRVEINTADLLADIAETVGLAQKERWGMEMLVSRDIFRNNACASEFILTFQRPR
jgi:site-specific DNA-methyltransferase (cytosine-N4-specific)